MGSYENVCSMTGNINMTFFFKKKKRDKKGRTQVSVTFTHSFGSIFNSFINKFSNSYISNTLKTRLNRYCDKQWMVIVKL